MKCFKIIMTLSVVTISVLNLMDIVSTKIMSTFLLLLIGIINIVNGFEHYKDGKKLSVILGILCICVVFFGFLF